MKYICQDSLLLSSWLGYCVSTDVLLSAARITCNLRLQTIWTHHWRCR